MRPLKSASKLTVCSYLETLYPLLVCGISLLYLTTQVVSVIRASEWYRGYKALSSSQHSWDIRTPYVERGASHYQDEDTDDDDAEFEVQREMPALERAKTHESVIDVNRPVGEVWLVAIEEAAVLGEVAVHLLILIYGLWGRHGRTAAIAELVTWAYVAVLAL